jgi:hypothetical protein
MVAERSLVDEGVTHGRFDDALNFSIEDGGRTEEDGGAEDRDRRRLRR